MIRLFKALFKILWYCLVWCWKRPQRRIYYVSLNEIVRLIGLNGGNISSAARGLKPMACGFKWKYKEATNV